MAADGIVCVYCGRLKSEHDDPEDQDDADSLEEGCDYSLNDCPGYEAGDTETAPVDKVIAQSRRRIYG